MIRRRIIVRGTVTGVGFRYFVYRLALARGLSGFVHNDSAGVILEVEGEEPAVEDLCRRLVDDAPPLARVTSVDVTPISPIGGHDFRVVATTTGATERQIEEQG